MAEAALAEKGCVAPIDVLMGLGWRAPVRVDEWRQGRTPVLERGVQANLSKISDALPDFRRWPANATWCRAAPSTGPAPATDAGCSSL